MSNFACVRTDNMSGTIDGKNTVSLKFDGDIENGSVVLVGGYVSGEREVRTATAPAKDSSLYSLALVAAPEVIKDKKYYALSDFINVKGVPFRGYRLTPNDIFSVTKEAFGAADNLSVGSIVEVDPGKTKFVAKVSATEGTTTIGKITAVEGIWYVIEVAAPASPAGAAAE